MPNNDIEAIAEAASGLLYPSESDEPLDVFSWPKSPGSAFAAVKAHEKAGAKIADCSFEDFFDPLREVDDADRFTALRKAIERTLSDPKVFRVGERQVTIYVIGRSNGGGWAGVKTVSIET